jgi:ATP-dependent DNA helicase RecQ
VDSPQQILEQYFGHTAFRPLQLEIINHVIEKKDTLAILPTGGGKSLCYQIPAMMMDGLCIVITPLIALMKDQVKNLQEKNIEALAIYSGLTLREINLIYNKADEGKIKFLFVSPERLNTAIFLDYAEEWNISLIVLDEAHCISQWGYDFRPDYLEINTFRDLKAGVPILALTASATQEVQHDIIDKLNFKNHQTFFTTFIRENISYSSFLVENKIVKTLDILQKTKGSSIVYCRTRKTTQFLCDALKSSGLNVDYYHAGLTQDTRSEKQDAWFDNSVQTIICTNAFGMGIDKPDVKTVIHFDIPESIEAYYQEAGRCGRDGNKAYAVLLYQQKDLVDLEKNIDLKYPSIETIKNIYADVGDHLQIPINTGIDEGFVFDSVVFCKAFKHTITEVLNTMKLLEQQKFWQLSEYVFLQSRVMLICNEQDVYDMEKLDATCFEILQQLIRMYGGIWNNYTNIREAQLAKKTNLEIDVLIIMLHKLHALQLIDYIPSTEKPQLYYLHDRVQTPYLTINTKLIDWLKKRYVYRVTNMINYATDKKICKQQLIANYFNEKTKQVCNICSTCLQLQKVYTQKDFDAIKNNLLQELTLHNAMAIQTFCKKYSTLQQDYVLKIIRFMLDERLIKMNSFGEIVKI